MIVVKYKYKGEFIPVWYKEIQISKQVNHIKICVCILLLLNIIFLPSTINRFKKSCEKNENYDVQYNRIKDNYKEPNDFRALRWLCNSRFYDDSIYNYKNGRRDMTIYISHLPKENFKEYFEIKEDWYNKINIEKDMDLWKVNISIE